MRSEYRALLGATLVLALAVGVTPVSAGPAVTADWEEKYYNPKPAPDDLILPMPCGGAMAFRAIEIPSGGLLDDRRVELGHGDANRGFKEGRRASYVAGAFTALEGAQRVYYLAKYETTRNQYALFPAGDCVRPKRKGRLPVTDLSWFDAVDFSRQYSEWLLANADDRLPKEGDEPGFLRLPTEEEWEYATRGGSRVDQASFLAPRFPMQGGLARHAWYGSTLSAAGKLRPAGLLQPNPVGLHDMLGNAAEMAFLPFFLDHRGRLHGQAGGFVTRGGDVDTPANQLTSATRQEYSYFSRHTKQAKRLKNAGFRLVISAPVIVSKERLDRIKEAWSILPTLRGDAGEQARQAMEELEAVATSAKDRQLRAKLELIQRDVEQAHAAMNEARTRTLRGLVRTGAFMAKRVSTDNTRQVAVQRAIDAARAKFEYMRAQVEGKPGAETILADLREKTESRTRKWEQLLVELEHSLDNTLGYYGETVISVGTDYAQGDLRGQLEVVKSEFRVRRNEYLSPYAEQFVEHAERLAKGETADKELWLKNILAIASRGKASHETD